MAENIDDILNEPIKAEDFTSDDFPEKEEDDNDIVNDNEVMDDLDFEDDEVDPIGDIGLGDSEFESELMDDSPDLPEDEEEKEEFIAPEEQVRWTVVPQENGDIWTEHVNGFILRARPLSAKQGSKIKYSVQLFKDQKIIEKGIIWIDREKDATEYLQNIADRILDRLGLTNLSNMEPEKTEMKNTDDELDDELDDDLDLDDEV